ncbi:MULTISPECIES: molybdopterin-guanine dinucleotide biosynthesis protein B [Thalassobaculum]|uniref:Molybdopterin guanine dinucleotide biosynthesis accessory protein MobB n=1 Tax=Thalassobaculum litoreum DSM 18839 TaxID=1123362 RepID=A0A8G2EVI1_9PROT|nr:MULTISPECIES: molybdopterin-guanine dinucleotide biosynthesis protein B [Thalassobaculum]SDF28927.1 molybdopterin guanine dinucleotide biosynthesis accessory protein MobB [Thalassobaculum litoreum DSM 18839]
MKRVFGIAGWSGSGKTTLLRALIPALCEGGVTVSTIKHAHHDFDIDRPGKDSYLHRTAGAHEVMISSGHRFALMHELRDAPEPTLAELVDRLGPVDIVLVEGFKFDPVPKLEVHRPALGKPPIWPGEPHIVAIAADVPLPNCERPVFGLDDIASIAAMVLDRAAEMEATQ